MSISESACVCVCACESIGVCVYMSRFMCDREYVREYKTESVPSVCEREGVSVFTCKGVCLCERERQKEKDRETERRGKREEGGEENQKQISNFGQFDGFWSRGWVAYTTSPEGGIG